MSTFGLLWQLKQAEVATLIDILIAIGCLEQEDIDRFRPVLKLTPLGGDVMRGKAELPTGLKLPGELRLKLRRPAAPRTSRAKAASPRLQAEEPDGRAASTPYKPVDEVPDLDGRASDSQSRDPPRAANLPGQKRDQRNCRPPQDDSSIVGSADESDSFEAAMPGPMESASPPAVSPPPPVVQAPVASRPPYYWTWLLLSRGFATDECLAIRGITRETLLDHLLQAAEDGLDVRLAWCLPAETIAAMKKLIGGNRPKQLRPLLAQLPPGTRYEEVQVYLKCREP